MSIVEEITQLAEIVARWIKAGLKVEEINARLADPSGVAQRLIRRAIERQEAGADYLGRDPDRG